MRQRLPLLVLTLALLLWPNGTSAQSTVDLVIGSLDTFWAQNFANAGLPYTSPQIRAIDGPMSTPCGEIAPEFGPGAYCAGDDTIYYSTAFAPDDANSEVFWFTVLGHEWGHHVQQLTDMGIDSSFEAEQQADCFSCAFLEYAKETGLLSPLAVTAATSLTQSAGDVWYELPADSPDHGNKAERAASFMTGVTSGVAACGFPG